MPKKSSSRILILRATLKILSSISILWLVYIFMAGFFDSSETDTNIETSFDLASVKKEEATYFKVKDRELLIILKNKNYSIFWAYDPIYGCRLEYIEKFIKPVCIDIEYNLHGFNSDKSQQLLIPEYKITKNKILIIY